MQFNANCKLWRLSHEKIIYDNVLKSLYSNSIVFGVTKTGDEAGKSDRRKSKKRRTVDRI